MEIIKNYKFNLSENYSLFMGFLSVLIFIIGINNIANNPTFFLKDDIAKVIVFVPPELLKIWLYLLPLYSLFYYIASHGMSKEVAGLHNFISVAVISFVIFPLIGITTQLGSAFLQAIAGITGIIALFMGWEGILIWGVAFCLTIVVGLVLALSSVLIIPIHMIFLLNKFLKGIEFIFFAEPLEIAAEKAKNEFVSGNANSELNNARFAEAMQKGNDMKQDTEMRGKKINIAADILKGKGD